MDVPIGSESRLQCINKNNAKDVIFGGLCLCQSLDDKWPKGARLGLDVHLTASYQGRFQGR